MNRAVVCRRSNVALRREASVDRQHEAAQGGRHTIARDHGVVINIKIDINRFADLVWEIADNIGIAVNGFSFVVPQVKSAHGLQLVVFFVHIVKIVRDLNLARRFASGVGFPAKTGGTIDPRLRGSQVADRVIIMNFAHDGASPEQENETREQQQEDFISVFFYKCSHCFFRLSARKSDENTLSLPRAGKTDRTPDGICTFANAVVHRLAADFGGSLVYSMTRARRIWLGY